MAHVWKLPSRLSSAWTVMFVRISTETPVARFASVS
jgi:hypothetical protein